MLVEAGADVNAWDAQNERTPYGLAWRMGRPDVCELLAELGARREVGPVDELIGLAFAGDRDGALQLAAQDPARAERVRTEFAEALHQAAAEGRREAVEILLDLGVPIDRPGERGGTPLHHAAWWGHGDVVAALLARGADPAREADGGATPLMWTAHGSFHSPGPVAGGGTDHHADRAAAGAGGRRDRAGDDPRGRAGAGRVARGAGRRSRSRRTTPSSSTRRTPRISRRCAASGSRWATGSRSAPAPTPTARTASSPMPATWRRSSRGWAKRAGAVARRPRTATSTTASSRPAAARSGPRW